jgi:cytochrome c oxidase assembly protein subunit 15
VQLLLAAALLQASLGVATLLNGVPVSLGLLHQAGALFLFGACLVVLHTVRTRAADL